MAFGAGKPVVLADFLDAAVAIQASRCLVDQFDATVNILQDKIGILIIAVNKTFGVVVGIEPQAVHRCARLQRLFGIFAVSFQKKEWIAEIGCINRRFLLLRWDVHHLLFKTAGRVSSWGIGSFFVEGAFLRQQLRNGPRQHQRCEQYKNRCS